MMSKQISVALSAAASLAWSLAVWWFSPVRLMVVMMTVVAVVNSMPVIPVVCVPRVIVWVWIKKIHAGDCTAKGRFLSEGVLLAERESTPLDIPCTIDLGEGLEI